MKTLIGFMGMGLFIAMVGCGSDSPGNVSGTIHGASVGVSDAISAAVAITGQAGTQHLAAVIMTSTPNACGDAAANIEHPNMKFVDLSMFDVNGTTFNAPTAPGTYSIYQGTGTPPAKAATFNVGVIDATCMTVDAMSAKATTGTVTLTGVSGNAFSGSFDVALDSGDHVTGSFSPGECAALQTVINTMTAPTCM